MRKILSSLLLFLALFAGLSNLASAVDPATNDFHSAGHEHEGGHGRNGD
jgi:hypothetical protein